MAYFEFGTSNIDEINRFLLDRMENSLFLMKTEKRLCDDHSAQIAIEYGFKGDKDAVYNQLVELFEHRKQVPYTEADIPELDRNKSRWLEYIQEKKLGTDGEYKRRFTAALGSGDPNKWAELDAYSKKMLETKETVHLKKECLCFNNF